MPEIPVGVDGVDLRELRPKLEIHDLPRTGHYPQTEAPAEVLRAYAAFRRGVAGSGTATA